MDFLQLSHNIAIPQETLDLIYFPRTRKEHVFKYTVAMQFHANAVRRESSLTVQYPGKKPKETFKWPVKCCRCSSSSQWTSERIHLFELDGVKSHIKAK